MSKKNGHAEPFIILPRSLLFSKAWQSMSIHTRRLLDFLMVEHMRHGGRKNGFLVAPRDQLNLWGIGKHFVSGAIEDAEYVGLIDRTRSKGRAPSRYALTWLPLADGTAPSNRWQHSDQKAMEVFALRKLAKTRLSEADFQPAKVNSLRCP
jgi:hypothetical protein